MAADVFAKEAVQAIFMRENELQISDNKLMPFYIMLRGIFPDLAFIRSRNTAKGQVKAIKGTKKNEWFHSKIVYLLISNYTKAKKA